MKNPDPIPPDAIGLSEAAKLLPGRAPGKRLSTRCLVRWILSGRLRGWRVGKLFIVSRAEVLALPRRVERVPPPEDRPRTRAAIAAGEQWGRMMIMG